MAIILKESKTFNPTASSMAGISLEHGDYYANIKEYQYSAEHKVLNFMIAIYGNESIRGVKDARPIEVVPVNIIPEKFDEAVGNKGIDLAGCYTLALEMLTDWKSDE